MFPESLEFGKNFVWFVGVVEDRMDPNFLGRVRVRCFGHHTADRNLLPTEDLPWAMIMQSATSAAQTEVGHSPTGLVDGSWVVGFFMDGDEAQQPLVLGSLGGYANKPNNLNYTDSVDWARTGFKDVRDDANLEGKSFPKPPVQVRRNRGTELGVNIYEDSYVERYPRSEEENNATTMRLARGIFDERNYHNTDVSLNTSIGKSARLFKEPLGSKIINENKSIETARDDFYYDQPSSPYQAIYPFNQVWQTESGHVLEFDDSPGAERIHEYHRSGTFREIHPSGKLISQTMDEKYDLTESNSYEYVKGSKFETHKQGFYQLINAAEVGGVDGVVRVAGAGNYMINVDNGDFKCVVDNGAIEFAARSLQLRSQNELIQTSHLVLQNGGSYRAKFKNDITLESEGIVQTTSDSYMSTTKLNYNIVAGDNYSVRAYHTASLTVENTFAMFPFYIPEPIAIRQTARVGHIEINAQDGDTKIVSRRLKGLFDQASLVVTSPLPSSIVSIVQPQPSPELETHSSHPGSIVGQTRTGYVYFQSLRGDIVLETQSLNSIKLKATPVGKLEETAGKVQITATTTDTEITSAQDTTIDSGSGFYSKSLLSSHIQAGGDVYLKSGQRVDLNAKTGMVLHTDLDAVRIGQYNAIQPAIKGDAFSRVFLRHTHLTPMGPTGPVDVVNDQSITTDLVNSYCKKVYVF